MYVSDISLYYSTVGNNTQCFLHLLFGFFMTGDNRVRIRCLQKTFCIRWHMWKEQTYTYVIHFDIKGGRFWFSNKRAPTQPTWSICPCTNVISFWLRALWHLKIELLSYLFYQTKFNSQWLSLSKKWNIFCRRLLKKSAWIFHLNPAWAFKGIPWLIISRVTAPGGVMLIFPSLWLKQPLPFKIFHSAE